MQKILQYEKRLLEYRSELNQLMEEYSQGNDADRKLMEIKIDALKRELDSMQQQLDLLKRNVSDIPQNTPVQQAPVRDPAPTYIQASSQVATSNPAPTPTYYQSAPGVPPQQPVSRPKTPVRTPKSQDFESLMGKSLMGIFASVLIFISLIFFATLVLPSLSDTVKMVLMYLVSFAFLAAGLFLLWKNHDSKLALALSGCGLGAVYLSLFISHIYFKALGEIPLYILIFIWAVFVCFLSRFQAWVFQIIGQVGISIAVMFGISFCVDTHDANKFLFLESFFVVTEILFSGFHLQKEYHKNIVNIVSQLLCLTTLMSAVTFFDSHIVDSTIRNLYHIVPVIYHIIPVIFILFCIFIGFAFTKVEGKFEDVFGGANVFYFLFLCALYNFNNRGLVIIILALLVLAGIAWKFSERKIVGNTVLQIFLMLMLIIHMYYLEDISILEDFNDYIYLAVLIVPFLLYGFYKKDILYKIAGMVYLTFFVFHFDMNNTANFVLGLFMFALLVYLLKYRGQYNTYLKTFCYILFYLFMAKDLFVFLEHTDLKDMTSAVWYFILMSILHLAIKKTAVSRHWITGEPERFMEMTTNICNAILMLSGTVLIGTTKDDILHLLVILMALALFTINSANLLKRHMAFGIYVGIKFTLLMIVILNSFDAPNYIISISSFLLAIASIVCGFRFRFKSLRVYGLVLSLLSIAKLILLDITYENTLGHACSFFICGVLSFVISMIYNYVDKKWTEEK